MFDSGSDSSAITPNTVSYDKVGSTTEIVDLGRADGQSYAVTFPNGGTIFWEDGGSTANVSFSIGGQWFSMAISIGCKASGVTGYGMICLPGEATIMGAKKRIVFTRWHVYGWDELTNTQIDQYVILPMFIFTIVYKRQHCYVVIDGRRLALERIR